MSNIKDILVISDLDNTLLTAENGIPEYNLQMIKQPIISVEAIKPRFIMIL